jgi:hypothetical protein
MEVLAIGLLGFAGKYISERFSNKNDEDEEDEEDVIKNTGNKSGSIVNGFDQKNKVQEKMNEVALDKKNLSNDPNNKNIIPTLYNKRTYELDVENKYLSSNNNYNNTNGETMLDLFKTAKNLMEGPPNELTSLDEQFQPMTINNKKPDPVNMGKLTLPNNWTPYNNKDDDMTYKIFNKDELIHNNMQPFFKDKGLLITEENSRNMEQTLDLYTGSSRFYYAKKEVPNIMPIFVSKRSNYLHVLDSSMRSRRAIETVCQNMCSCCLIYGCFISRNSFFHFFLMRPIQSKDVALHGEVPLNTFFLRDATIEIVPFSKHVKSCVFEIQFSTSSGNKNRTLVLEAQSETDRQEWVDALISHLDTDSDRSRSSSAFFSFLFRVP